MASKSSLPYPERAKIHPNPLAKKLFEIASTKQTNVVLSADVTSTAELLSLADSLGPYIAVLKTHIDIISDFHPTTTLGPLQTLAHKHNFLLFEDRKFIDIGSTVQKQYRGGTFSISTWAHIVNASILAGEGIIEALSQVIINDRTNNADDARAVLILAEMTSAGSLAVGSYTRRSVEIARKFPGTVLGFVATRELSSAAPPTATTAENFGKEEEDFLVFTTGVNLASKGDSLGQQYQTPASAVARGADFIIAGRGIYAAPDPVAAVKQYREEGWKAYAERTGGAS